MPVWSNPDHTGTLSGTTLINIFHHQVVARPPISYLMDSDRCQLHDSRGHILL